MPSPCRLWIETAYHAAFRYGGWAYVLAGPAGVSGAAGGERNTTGARIELAALTAALEALLPASAAEVRTSSATLLGAGRRITSPDEAAEADDALLWSQLRKAAAGRALVWRTAAGGAGTPAAFLKAWSEVGQDKAKAQGRFRAPIPKPNLAKLKLD
jgi:ribonuclease HI